MVILLKEVSRNKTTFKPCAGGLEFIGSASWKENYWDARAGTFYKLFERRVRLQLYASFSASLNYLVSDKSKGNAA